ncbi:MAG: prepilin-type N-terminal cleavage/methylation domain-containing protein [bacterium]|nr:prepilin-type N-terminal cleavage/methylation domain-containing protein [bacterium]MDZ4284568.1 prepilin-type N-terminal cleavage/methylation domain-containing protein [Patescibacteria group bacterium]
MLLTTKPPRGFSLVEVVVGSAIILIVLGGLIAAFTRYAATLFRTTDRVQATYLAEEGIEVARILRDASWTSFAALTLDTPYRLALSSGVWEATTSEALIDGAFDRTMTLQSVYRRTSDSDIVASTSLASKAIDPDARYVLVRLSWSPLPFSEASAEAFEAGSTDGDLGGFPSNNGGNGDIAQGFTVPAGSDIVVPRVELYLRRVTAAPSDLYLEIRSGSTVGPVVATSATLDGASLPATLLWTSFTFPTRPTLTGGVLYHLRLRSDPDSTVAFSGSIGTIHWGYLQADPSPYGGGIARRYVGRLGNPLDEGQALDQYDFSFRVYKEVPGGFAEAIEYTTHLVNLFETP